MIEIGWATEADIPGAIDVLCEIADFRASLGQDRWRKKSFTRDALAAWIERGELAVARLDGKVVGVMLVEHEDKVFWPDDPPGEALYVHKLARSRKEPRARGLVRPLMDFAQAAARAEGRPYVRLDCAMDEKLAAIYEGLGFTRLDVWEVTPDFVSWRWEKRL